MLEGVKTTAEAVERQPRGGRGARERILTTAEKLFYEQGVNATGMEQLTSVAHVSRRTFYQHFAGKDDLVAAYLARVGAPGSTGREQVLDRTDLAARERLLALFRDPPDGAALRGCPFHNAAVEFADTDSAVRTLVGAHKRAFTRRVTEVATEAGAADPAQLGSRLAVLFEGATSLALSLNEPRPFADARELATLLVDAATEGGKGRRPGVTVIGDHDARALERSDRL